MTERVTEPLKCAGAGCVAAAVPKRFERGPLRGYEVIWRSGYVETVYVHEVHSVTPNVFAPYPVIAWIKFYAELNGVWQLVLQVRDVDIQSVRLVDGGLVL